jgi:hypothetical protein
MSLKPAAIFLCRRREDLPGLDELYLTTMDSIENITRADALYLLQGSALSGTGARYGLSSGEWQEVAVFAF